jgi:hypothetical protein
VDDVFPLTGHGTGSKVYDWQVSETWQGSAETQQDNWNIDSRYSLGGMWLFLSSSQQAFDFETPSSAEKTLYVRWHSYPDAGTATAQADTTPCA